MQIVAPTWHLKQQCPCCGQDGPLLVACKRCGNVAAECEEIGTFFASPYQLEPAASAKCSRCGTVGSDAFVAASAEQIQHAGIAKELHH